MILETAKGKARPLMEAGDFDGALAMLNEVPQSFRRPIMVEYDKAVHEIHAAIEKE